MQRRACGSVITTGSMVNCVAQMGSMTNQYSICEQLIVTVSENARYGGVFGVS